MFKVLGFALGLFLMVNGYTQSVGDFRSSQSGNWNDVDTWQRYDGATWVNPAPNTPTNADGIITLRQNHIITVSEDVTADQIEYENDEITALTGSLVVSSGAILTIADGPGDDIRLLNDFTAFALLQVDGTLSLTSGASIVDDDYGNLGIGPGPVTQATYRVRDGGVHIHNVNTGTDIVPAADWQTGSTCRINILAGNAPIIPSSVVFHHLIWDGTAQTGLIDLNSTLDDVEGDFTVLSTGGFVLRLVGATPSILNYNGNFNIQGNSRVQLITSASSSTVNIGGNFDISSSNVTSNAISFNSTGTLTVNVTGDFTKSGASMISLLAAPTGTTTLNLGGSFSLSGSTITCNAAFTSGSAAINFIGSNSSTFSNTGTISNEIDFLVESGRSLNLGTSAITGTGTFTNNGTITLANTHVNGVIQSSPTSNGNIRVSGTRTFASGSTIILNGGTQATGTAFPTDVNVTVSNSSVVTLTSNLTISANRQLVVGSGSSLIIGANALTINGTIATASGLGTFVGGDNSGLFIGGTGSLGDVLAFSGTTTLQNLTLNRTSSGSVTLGSDLTVAANGGTFTHTAGNIDISNRTFTVDGDLVRTAGNMIVNSNSNYIMNGSGTITGTVAFSGTALNSLTMNRALTSFSAVSNFTLDTLNLYSGTLNNTGTITMADGGLIERREGTIITNAPVAAGSYDVIYNISAPISTGFELPTGATQLNNLTKTGAETLTLASAITINGTWTNSNGIFDSNGFDIDLQGNLVSNTTSSIASSEITFSGTTQITGSTAPVFGNIVITGTLTPSIAYRVNGNLTNNGTLNPGNVTFGGTTAITGSSTSSFNNVSISGALTAPSGLMNVAGNFVNNGTFTNNGGTVVFNGTSSISGSASATFNNLTISGTLTSPTILTLTGNFTNNGTFNRGTGTVAFAGSATQNINGSSVTTFNNISVTNVGGPPAVRVQSNQNLAGVLTLASNSTFDADGASGTAVFTLLSTSDNPTADAGIATLPSGAAVTGNVTAQRFMTIEGANGGRIYRYISSPVSGATVADMQNEIPVTGTFTGASTGCSGCTTNPSIWTYNESNLSTNLVDGYVAFPTTSNTQTFQTGVGYAMFVRGDILGSAQWDLRGTINSGTVNFGVTYNSTGTPSDDGWNLVGNPYPSTIDWNSGAWTKSNISNTIYVLDNASGVWATYNGSTGTNGGSRYIAAGQGFWVQTNNTSPSLIATESVKTAGQSTTFIREEHHPIELLRIALSQGEARDETVISFAEGADALVDPMDARKRVNSIFNISSKIGNGEKLAINTLPSLNCSSQIDLDISGTNPGQYLLEFSEFETFPDGVQIKLLDHYLNKTINVSHGTYAFEITIDENSFLDNRFSVVFSADGFDPDFTFTSTDVCSEESAKIIIEHSRPELLYFVKAGGETLVEPITGNGQDLTLSLSPEQLPSEENIITLYAQASFCESAGIEKQTIIHVVNKPEVILESVSPVCLEGDAVLEVSGAQTYNWYEKETDTNPIQGEHQHILTVSGLIKSKTYYVAGINALGCEGPRTAARAEVFYFDPVTLGQADQILTSSYASGNSWYLNGELLEGESGSALVIKTPGTYQVEVVLESGCVTSDEVDYLILGTENKVSSSITVYPNPVKAELVILVPREWDVKNVTLLSYLGQEMGSIQMQRKENEWEGGHDMADMPDGFYTVKILLQNGEVYYHKVLKE